MLSFRLTRDERFALAQLEGVVSLDAWGQVLQELADELKATAAPARLVIDMTGVMGYLGIPERRAVGSLMAQHFGTCDKVAIVVQAQKITDVVSGEARQQGLDLRLFAEFDEAVAWMAS